MLQFDPDNPSTLRNNQIRKPEDSCTQGHSRCIKEAVLWHGTHSGPISPTIISIKTWKGAKNNKLNYIGLSQWPGWSLSWHLGDSPYISCKKHKCPNSGEATSLWPLLKFLYELGFGQSNIFQLAI